MIDIEQVNNLNELKEIIIEFDEQFIPSLKSRVNDIKKYSEKLYDNAITLKAIYRNEIVGFVSFYCNDKNNHIAYLTQIAVKPEARGKKIGLLLLNKVTEFSRNNGMKYIMLEVYNQNEIAKKLYSNAGFNYADDASDQSVHMQKKL